MILGPASVLLSSEDFELFLSLPFSVGVLIVLRFSAEIPLVTATAAS